MYVLSIVSELCKRVDIFLMCTYIAPVFKINSAFGTRHAHFRARAHGFLTYAHVFSPIYHSYILEECIEKSPGA